jgi:hypothetical protein
MKRLIAVLLVAGTAACLTVWLRSRPPNHRAPDDDARAVAELRREIDEIRRAVHRSEAVSGAAARIALAPETRAGQQQAPVRRPLTLPDEEVHRRTERKFNEEAKDRGWAAAVERQVGEEAARTLPAGADVRDVDCRSKMCRSRIVYPDRAGYEASTQALTTDPAANRWPGGRAWSPLRERPDGKFEQEAYFFREGQDPISEIYEEEEARLALK